MRENPCDALSLCMLVLDPYCEHKFLEFSNHVSLHFLDIATEVGKISLFIWMEICCLRAFIREHSSVLIPDSEWCSQHQGECLTSNISGQQALGQDSTSSAIQCPRKA